MIVGKANRPSRTYNELVKKYQGKLHQGGKAPKRFAPEKARWDQKQQLMEDLKREVTTLNKRLKKYSEASLDELILPHPLLGKLTLRAMLYFTIYHAGHHHHLIENSLNQIN
jgi:hypothetical protein